MTIIRQESLFSIQELYEMEPTHRYESIISVIDLDAIYYEVNKKSHLGAPVDLNYAAMIISVFIRYVERIPTVKDLIKRLKDDFVFKLNCGFLVSDHTPSEAAYSRLLTKLKASNVLEKVQEKVVLQAIAEGFIMDDTVAIDATHFEARDQTPPKEEKQKAEPKNAGANPKKNVNNGLLNRQRKKPIYHFSKRK